MITCIECGTEQTHRVCVECFAKPPKYCQECYEKPMIVGFGNPVRWLCQECFEVAMDRVAGVVRHIKAVIEQ